MNEEWVTDKVIQETIFQVIATKTVDSRECYYFYFYFFVLAEFQSMSNLLSFGKVFEHETYDFKKGP